MDFSGTLAGGLSGSMHFGSDGDSIDINPIVTSGTKIATFTINAGTEEEEVVDLYTPDTLSWDDITDKPSFFSGSYVDLSNKPTLNGDVINGNMYGLDFNSNNDKVVGKNHDGKLIYCKVLDIPLNISPLPVELPSNTYQYLGILYGTIEGNDYVLHFPYYDSPNYWAVCEYHKQDHTIYINSSPDMRNYYDTIHLNILYTLSS